MVVEQREPEPPEVERADADVLDIFYRSMAKATGLTTEHKVHLTKTRDLKKYRLDGYCSWPPVPVADVMRTVERTASKELAARVTEQLERIPGLRRDDAPGFGLPGDGWAFCCTGCPGIALLSVDDLGRARGVQIRADEAIEGRCRYYWLSGGGEDRPSSGTPAGWIPVANNQLAEERHEYLGYRRPKYRPVAAVITEGKFKAEILAQWGYNAVYVSGVGVWRGAGVIDMVRRISPESAMVGIAYDADAAEKEQVAKQRTALADALLEEGFRPVIWTWPLEAGKGIDDLLMAKGSDRERGHKVLVTPYREEAWSEPAAEIKYDRPVWSEYPEGEVVTTVLSECKHRNGYSGWSLVECHAPNADRGPAVVFQRLPIWREGMVVRMRMESDERGYTARWSPATKEQVFQLYGAPEEEPPRGLEGSRKTPERRAWEAAEKAEAATAVLRLACSVDLLFKDTDENGNTKGLPCDKVALAIAKWGSEAAKQLELNPYQCGFDLGISLQACDRIRDTHKGDDFWKSNERLAWCCEFAMQYSTDSGHTRVPVDEVMRRIRGYCQCEEKDPDPALVIPSQHYLDKDPDGVMVIAHGYYEHCERAVAENLANRHTQGQVRSLTVDGYEALRKAEEGMSEDQQRAVETLLETPGAVCLTGGPGTGKTYVLSEALRIYKKSFPNAKIKLCAPTGRAAQRLGEACGMESSTIHSLLDMRPYQPGVQAVDVDVDLLICDEMSMAEIGLVHDLLRAIPFTAQVWLCGDSDQLEAVGPGAFLYDTLAAGQGIVGMTRLTTMHRQTEGSAILTAGQDILKGNAPTHNGKDFSVVECDTSERAAKTVVDWTRRMYDPEHPYDVQVLCVTNRPANRLGEPTPGGTREMNAKIQKKVNPHRDGENELTYGTTTFRPRDKVVICRNRNANGHIVYSNGDIGVVTAVSVDSMTIQLKTGKDVCVNAQDLPDVKLAYALTVHKAQGGEYKDVLVCLPSCQVHKMPGLTRNLLYTGVTRAAKRCAIACDGDALETAVSAPMHTRRTGLQRELWGQRRRLLKQEQEQKQGQDDGNPFSWRAMHPFSAKPGIKTDADELLEELYNLSHQNVAGLPRGW